MSVYGYKRFDRFLKIDFVEFTIDLRVIFQSTMDIVSRFKTGIQLMKR